MKFGIYLLGCITCGLGVGFLFTSLFGPKAEVLAFAPVSDFIFFGTILLSLGIFELLIGWSKNTP